MEGFPQLRRRGRKANTPAPKMRSHTSEAPEAWPRLQLQPLLTLPWVVVVGRVA